MAVKNKIHRERISYSIDDNGLMTVYYHHLNGEIISLFDINDCKNMTVKQIDRLIDEVLTEKDFVWQKSKTDMTMTVLDFLNAHLDDKYDIYLYTFDRQVVKIDSSTLREITSPNALDEEAFEYHECIINDNHSVLIEEDEITYLRRKNKEQNTEIKRLRESLFYYRDSINVQRNSLADAIIHTFMPKGYKRIDYRETHNSTPYRRGIANSLFLLEERGYVLPDDVKPFMARYKTKKTTRR